ncbi:hypothetical protein ScPMuIL_009029 [Solemya velum]
MATSLADTSASNAADKTCDIEATVSTGFENVAKEEAIEKFNTEVVVSRGKILVKRIPMTNVKQILDLGTIDNCQVLMTREPDFQFTQDIADCMRRLRDYVKKVDWQQGLAVWHKFFSFEHPIPSQPEVIPESLGDVILSVITPKSDGKRKKKNKGRGTKKLNFEQDGKKEADSHEKDILPSETVDSESVPSEVCDARNVHEQADECMAYPYINKDKTEADKTTSNSVTSIDTGLGLKKTSDKSEKSDEKSTKGWDSLKPSFRVTCYRSGEGHCFDSMTAAANFGGAGNDYFGWNVKMTNFDIEVVLSVEGTEVTVGLALTKQSLHRRNIISFGPTTLRPTIAFSMLRLCSIQPGDVVCDPMCGSGSIPIQASISWPESIHLCGEIHPKALARTLENIDELHRKRKEKAKKDIKVDIVFWDTCHLPMKNNTVDVFVTDMPFGKRVGHRVENWKLYPSVLMELARVAKLNTARACLLTQDKKCMIKSLQSITKYWRRMQTLGVNIGGLSAGVYLLHRTATDYEHSD